MDFYKVSLNWDKVTVGMTYKFLGDISVRPRVNFEVVVLFPVKVSFEGLLEIFIEDSQVFQVKLYADFFHWRFLVKEAIRFSKMLFYLGGLIPNMNVPEICIQKTFYEKYNRWFRASDD
jgi:hypothetical protein